MTATTTPTDPTKAEEAATGSAEGSVADYLRTPDEPPVVPVKEDTTVVHVFSGWAASDDEGYLWACKCGDTAKTAKDGPSSKVDFQKHQAKEAK